MLVKLGHVLNWSRSEGVSELQEASDRFLAAGDLEAAADAEAMLGNVLWSSGQHRIARAHNERATDLIAGIPDSRTTLRVRAFVWRARILGGDEFSLEDGRRILELTEELGSNEEILNIRITLATAHAYRGSPSLDRGARGGPRGCAPGELALRRPRLRQLASVLGTAGDLRRCADLHREGVEIARRFGSRLEYWLMAECALDDYLAGRWEEAVTGATRFLEVRGAARYMDHVAHYVLASVAASRGGAGAGEHAQLMLAAARSSGDPQSLWSVLGPTPG